MVSENIFSKKGSILRKMWINQFAFSLFGLFVASPFTGALCVAAGIFSFLFYLSVVGYAVLDDAQKDRISFRAGRNLSVCALTGAKYSFFAFIPTIALTLIYTILTFIPAVNESVSFIISIITRFVMCGEILGIDIGLTAYSYNSATMQMITSAPDSVIFMSSHGLFCLIFSVAAPLILGLIYYLGFSGVVSINTTAKKKED